MNPLPKTALETGVAMEKNMVAVAVNNGYGLALYDPQKNRWLALDQTGPKLTTIPTVDGKPEPYLTELDADDNQAWEAQARFESSIVGVSLGNYFEPPLAERPDWAHDGRWFGAELLTDDD